MRRYTLIFACLVCLAVATAGVATAQTITGIDDDHGLVEPESVDTYDNDSVATATVDQPSMRLTVAESSADVGLDGWRFDANKQYLRIEYNETISRTIRVFIPSEYWHPIAAEIDAERPNDDVTAAFRPTEDGRYTAVTVEFEGQTDAVFAIPRESELVFWTRDRSRDVINETVGYKPPQLSTGGEWQYIGPADLTTNETVPIAAPDGATIQQNDAQDGEESNWVGVPRCSRSSADVCTYTVDGQPEVIYLLTQTSEPPDIRFKSGADPVESGWSILRDLGSVPDRVWDDLSDLLPQ
jgi:hypothetical protein